MTDLARAAYDALPEPIKAIYTYLEYLWLGDLDKARLLEVETEPDHYDD